MGRYALIKNAAERKKTSINKIEKDLGLPKGSISKYDKNIPSIATIAKIANYLDTSIDSLTPESNLLEESTDRLHSILAKHKITTDNLCKELNLPDGSLFDWDTGLSQPDSKIITKVADYFGVTADWLLYGTSNVHKSASGKEYYFDDQTAKLAQELHKDPDMNMFMSSTRKLTPEQFNLIKETVKQFLKEDGFDV